MGIESGQPRSLTSRPGRSRFGRWVPFGLVSICAHAAALAGLIAVVGPKSPPAVPLEPTMDLLFAAVEPEPESPPPIAAEPISAPAAPEPPTVRTAEPPNPPAPIARPRPPGPIRPAATRPPPAATQPEAVPTAAPPPEAPGIVDPSWQTQVASWLAARKTYPEEARRRGEEGQVRVRFTVDRSGQVLAADIIASSGSERLDNALITLLRGAALPGFPASMAQSRITITTSVRYALR